MWVGGSSAQGWMHYILRVRDAGMIEKSGDMLRSGPAVLVLEMIPTEGAFR